ncbi:MAG: Gfo/Idh/MocA family oxidoreductase [Corynebacteriales bacterium]|nr:Gfo/Idh/MocA family oxidoreductase [Mycobacteriales bacterium]
MVSVAGSAAPRLGVVGLKMGLHLADWAERVGFQIAACCDLAPGALSDAQARFPAAMLTSRWQDLFRAGLDGVILANDFDAHAPLAMDFLARGIHVLSESAACVNESQGRELIDAARTSTATYSLAENYVVHPHVRLIDSMVQRQEIGRVQLIEADYLHSLSPELVSQLIKDPSHWRGRIAPTAYCTHTVSPILAITGADPVDVTAFTVDENDPRSAVVLMIRLSTGALAVARHGFLQGEPASHWSWVSARGERGIVESVRASAERSWSVRVKREEWTGTYVEAEKVPPHIQLSGTTIDRKHEGTVLLLQAFRSTIVDGAPPLVNVRDAVAASLVGVLGGRSLELGSVPVAIPSFT